MSEEWDLNEPELSWKVWVMLETMEWKHLPYAGGILDQPEWLMEDLYTLSARRSALKSAMKETPRSTITK